MTHPGSGDDNILCCDVGRERFAFRCADVRHVERADRMRAERSDDGRIGTLKLGGQHVPVFALGEVLGRTPPSRPGNFDGHIAVTGGRQALVGWLVDRIARVAQPAHGNIAVLPSIVGARAASWFEGIIWLGEDQSALLLAPDRLTAPLRRDQPHDEDVAFERMPSVATALASVAVIFSTTVLPAADAFRYALSGRQIAAIVQPTPPTAVPGCSDYVDGITWWRRTAVPVIDFRAPADRIATTYRRRLIVQCGARQHGSLVAFSIDPGVFMCRPAADHRQLPAVPCPRFASGVFDVNGETVALLDLDALLTNETDVERARLSES